MPYSPKSQSRLWIFSPSYLDLEPFLIVRERLLNLTQSLRNIHFSEVRFILIDDTGDQDPELELRSLPADIEVLSPPFNIGHQRAIVFGIRSKLKEISLEDFIVTLDSDGEDRPEDLNRLLQPLIADTSDLRRVAVAWRTKRKESITFKIMYFLFKIFFRLLTGQVIRSGNYAAYRGWTAHHIILHPHFDLCYSSSLISLNLKVSPVLCERGKRLVGKSRMNFPRLLLHGIRMLMPFLDRIAIRALMMFGAISLISAALALVIVGIKAFTNLGIPGWASYTLLLSLLLSITSFGQFIILITIVSQSQGMALSSLDKNEN